MSEAVDISKLEGETDDDRWLRVLPKPPEVFDELRIADWMEEVARIGSLEGLAFCYHPKNWPYTPDMRSRVQHVYGKLWRELEEAARFKEERAWFERSRQVADAEREARRKAGWRR